MAAQAVPAVMPTRISLEDARAAQAGWAATPLRKRLRVLRRARHILASASAALIDGFPKSLARSRADSYAAEVLPLLDACRYLEREAEHVLQARRVGREGRPFWLGKVESTVERVPLGVVLVIGPANYPLLLPGVQALQALAAGNAVVWKPGRDGVAVAESFAGALRRAGLPAGLLLLTDDTPEAGAAALRAGPDKVIFTGSGEAGRAVLLHAAEIGIPAVAELSGCDACVVLPSANRARVVDALAFAMRFNGSATCMAPRRLLLVGDGHDELLRLLRDRFAGLPAVPVPERTRQLLAGLLSEAGVRPPVADGAIAPVLVEHGRPEMRLAQTDVMAPVLTVLRVRDSADLLRANRLCPLGLTASIFGEEAEARRVAELLQVGTVTINDLIVPTADPRLPFGGRGGSGYGVTRGAEGLLEMTAVKTTIVRRGRSGRQFEATDARHEELFRGVVAASHGGTPQEKWAGVRTIMGALRRLGAGPGAGEER